MLVKLLFIGDIVGSPGRRAVKELVPQLREKHELDFVIANGENSAGGSGITPKTAEEIFSAGVDVITSGDHLWDQKDVIELLNNEKRFIRPLNYPPGTPGQGSAVFECSVGCSVEPVAQRSECSVEPVAQHSFTQPSMAQAPDGLASAAISTSAEFGHRPNATHATHVTHAVRIAVVNVQGRTFMADLENPFHAMQAEVKRLRQQQTQIIFVDVHAEATSEKVAMARMLDGQVSAVVGTHTHVQTADDQIFPGGTAYLTDAGFTGPHESVIGREIQPVIQRFLTSMPQRFEVAKERVLLQGVIVEIDESNGKAVGIQRISKAVA